MLLKICTQSKIIEKRFQESISLADFKMRIELITGISCENMILEVNGHSLKGTTLEACGLRDGSIISVREQNPQNAPPETIPIYEMSREAYLARPGNVVEFRNKLRAQTQK